MATDTSQYNGILSPIQTLMHEAANYPLLKNQEVKEYFEKLNDTKNELIDSHLIIVINIVNEISQLHNYSVLPDLILEGILGLQHTIETYKPSENEEIDIEEEFVVYATNIIKNTILSAIKNGYFKYKRSLYNEYLQQKYDSLINKISNGGVYYLMMI